MITWVLFRWIPARTTRRRVVVAMTTNPRAALANLAVAIVPVVWRLGANSVRPAMRMVRAFKRYVAGRCCLAKVLHYSIISKRV
jgi:hypothetical protein